MGEVGDLVGQHQSQLGFVFQARERAHVNVHRAIGKRSGVEERVAQHAYAHGLWVEREGTNDTVLDLVQVCEQLRLVVVQAATPF